MKHFFKFILLLSGSTFIMGAKCNKEDFEKSPQDITSAWSWYATYKIYPMGPLNPLTPNNTGVIESLQFNTDKTWKLVQNLSVVDSGTYTTGHGSFTNLSNSTFVYDSVKYYKNGQPVIDGVDYYSIANDTLKLDPYLRGHFISFSLPTGGSKYFKRK